MASTLRSTLQELAANFASNVLDAIRGASLEEILAEAEGGRATRGGGARASVDTLVSRRGSSGAAPRRRGGRLARRSAEDIGALVDRIVDLLGNHPEGLRAEQIRDALGVEAKELPRPLAEALEGRRISKSGQKRATTYFIRGAKAARGGASARGGAAAKAGRGGARRGGARKAAAKGRRGRGRRPEDGGAGEGSGGDEG